MPERLRLSSGTELNVVRWGEQGPLVLLHHATGLCARVWSEIAEPLARGCRLVAYDLRGHGASSADVADLSWEIFGADLLEVATRLADAQGEPVRLVVGHSLGGVAALLALEQGAHALERALLLDPVLIDAELEVERRADRRRASLLARMRRVEFDTIEAARRELSQHGLYRTWSARVLDDYLAGGLRPTDRGTWTLCCEPTTEARIYELGRTAVLERLGAWCERAEMLVSPTSAFAPVYQRLLAQRSALRQTLVPTSHMVPMEAPDAVIDAIARLVR